MFRSLGEVPRAVKDGVAYASAHYVANLFGALSGFVVRLWVPPIMFGAVTAVTGVLHFFRAFDGLLRGAIDREVPGYLRSGEPAKAEAVRRVAYTWLFVSLAIESVVLALAAWWSTQPELRWALTVYIAINAFDGISQADRITLKASQRLAEHNKALHWASSIGAVVLVAAAYLSGGVGFLVGTLIGSGIALVLFRRYFRKLAPQAACAVPGKTWLSEVAKAGGLVAVVKVAQELLFTADRFMLAQGAGLEDLGYYSLGLALASRVYAIPQSFVGSFSPQLNAAIRVGRLDEAASTVQRLQRVVVPIAFLTAGGAIVLVPVAVHLALPAYSATTGAIQFLLVGAYCISLNGTGVQVHVASGRVVPTAVAAVAGAVVVVGSSLVLVDQGLSGVALGRLFGLVLYAVLLDASAMKMLGVVDRSGRQLAGLVGVLSLTAVSQTMGATAAVALFGLLGPFALVKARQAMRFDDRD